MGVGVSKIRKEFQRHLWMIPFEPEAKGGFYSEGTGVFVISLDRRALLFF